MMHDDNLIPLATTRAPWNKGKIIGPKPPLLPKHVWSIRTRLHLTRRSRDLALFNLAIDSKMRGCDVVALRIEDVAPAGYTIDRATVRQRKTGRPVRFELTDQTRQSVDRAHRGKARIKARLLGDADPDAWDLPPKPKWMRWRTYNRAVEKFDRYEAILDAGTFALLARLQGII
jgi:hypothetical protein